VTAPRWTARARLTLLYTGLFVVCGAIVVAITYALVASLQTPATPGIACPGTDRVRTQCKSAFREAAILGARIQREATLSHLLQYSLVTLAAATLLAAVAGWVAAGRVLRPVQQITEAALAASEDNLSARISLRGPRDELRELADTFDAMLARLQAAFESQRRFIANAGHELRTPLTVMRTTLDVVLDKPDPAPGELHRMGQDVRATVDHAERLIGALLTLAHSDRGLTVCEPIDLATVAEDVLDSADQGDRRLHASLEPAMTSGDHLLLERMVANLVDNALRYNAPGRRPLAHDGHGGRAGDPGRREHRPGHRPGGSPPPVPALPAAARPHRQRRVRPGPRDRLVDHHRTPRRRDRRAPAARRPHGHRNHAATGRSGLNHAHLGSACAAHPSASPQDREDAQVPARRGDPRRRQLQPTAPHDPFHRWSGRRNAITTRSGNVPTVIATLHRPLN
jgi:signal transduction histidine kinase